MDIFAVFATPTPSPAARELGQQWARVMRAELGARPRLPRSDLQAALRVALDDLDGDVGEGRRDNLWGGGFFVTTFLVMVGGGFVLLRRPAPWLEYSVLGVGFAVPVLLAVLFVKLRR